MYFSFPSFFGLRDGLQQSYVLYPYRPLFQPFFVLSPGCHGTGQIFLGTTKRKSAGIFIPSRVLFQKKPPQAPPTHVPTLWVSSRRCPKR